MNYYMYIFNRNTLGKLFGWLSQVEKFWQRPIQSWNRPHDLSQDAVSTWAYKFATHFRTSRCDVTDYASV